MCRGGGRCSRKDLPAHLIHNEQVPFGICPHCLRQLRRDRDVSHHPPSPPPREKKNHYTSNLKRITLLTDRSPNSGSAMSLTLLDCSIPPVKRITTACARSLTRRLTCSWSASPSPHLLHSRTSAKSGSRKSTTTAPVFPA